MSGRQFLHFGEAGYKNLSNKVNSVRRVFSSPQYIALAYNSVHESQGNLISRRYFYGDLRTTGR